MNNTGWAVGHLGEIAKSDNLLPVELASFTATVNDNEVRLSWQTATETNNGGFEIERLQDSWQNVGFVEGHGTTTNEQNYSFIDKNLSPGKYQYRLKQIDYDVSFKYSRSC